MKLIPKIPPGRPNRKLLPYLDEIGRLRSAGYSVSAIHQTLKDAGVQVGLRTVFLEVAKLSGMTQTLTPLESTTSLPAPKMPIQTVTPSPVESPVVDISRLPTATDVDEFFSSPSKHSKFLKRFIK